MASISDLWVLPLQGEPKPFAWLNGRFLAAVAARRQGAVLHSARCRLMAAPIAVDGTTFSAGAPVALFQSRIVGGGTNIDIGRQYDVAPDGRFLINVATDEATASPITLILNWRAGVE